MRLKETLKASTFTEIKNSLTKYLESDVIVQNDDSGNMYFTKGIADKYPTYAVNGWINDSPETFEISRTTEGIYMPDGMISFDAVNKCGIFLLSRLLNYMPVCKGVIFQSIRNYDLEFFDNSSWVAVLELYGYKTYYITDYQKIYKSYIDEFYYNMFTSFRTLTSELIYKDHETGIFSVCTGALNSVYNGEVVIERDLCEALTDLQKLPKALTKPEPICTMINCKKPRGFGQAWLCDEHGKEYSPSKVAKALGQGATVK